MTTESRENRLTERRSTRLGLLTVASGFMLIMLLAGCSGAASPEQARETPAPTSVPSPAGTPTSRAILPTQRQARSGTVRLFFDWRPEEIRVLEDLLIAFQRAHPEIEIQLSFIPEAELQERSQAALESDDSPTLLLGPSSWARDLASRGLIRDLAESLSPEMQSRIHPMAWAQVEAGDQVLGLPFEMQGILLFRNDAIIGDRPDSVDELVLAAQAVRSGEVVGANLDFSLLNVLPFLHTCGGKISLESDQPPMTMEAGLCWLRLLNRLARSGPPVFSGPDDLAAFREGRSALLFESSELLPILQEDLGEGNLQVDLWPIYPLSEGRLVGYVWTDTIYFAADTSQADYEASWALATFLLAPESQRALAQARRVHHQSVLAELPVDDAVAVRIRRIFESGIPLPAPGALARIEAPLQTTIRLVVGAGGDPELALELALTEIANSSPIQAAPSVTPSPTQG